MLLHLKESFSVILLTLLLALLGGQTTSRAQDLVEGDCVVSGAGRPRPTLVLLEPRQT